ncbi:MAG: phosphoribosylformylglycinamidine synthase I [Saprospiraceae bacterium]|nr:phosphoribosylformylglycinamidine synthase I [Saprospiraceae bacterium]|tara:strand:- start:4227 stop:4928 length:702 start_codon:yes stop_codon:yes gene_type:complete
MKIKVVVFPGSNCDDDMVHVMSEVMGCETQKVWHKDLDINDLGANDCVILPGGFSYGDYLRSGAIARFAPIMKTVVDFANKGGLVLGICNGFQILCESGLLPGVLMRNEHQRFICKNVHLKKVHNRRINQLVGFDQILSIPIAHADGRFFATDETLKSIEDNEQIIFKYCDQEGNVNSDSNVNGSVKNIAGISNKSGNVFGMMPHPERASENILGNNDGRIIFESLLESIGAF